MIYTLEGISRITAEYQKGAITSKHLATDFYLEVSENLDSDKYMNKDDILTAIGSQAVTQAFVQGLIGNIHFAHQHGYRNDAAHLRYIISELERGFAAIAETSKGIY